MAIKNNKKAQLTIFIIIAIIIIAIVAFFFLLSSKKATDIFNPKFAQPEDYLDKCVKDAVKNVTEIMIAQGGYVNPKNYILYENMKVAYLCYTNLFYTKCTTQEPLYIKHIQDEITEEIKPKIERCFSNLKGDLEGQNYVVQLGGQMQVSTELMRNAIRVKIERTFDMTRNQETKRYEEFKSVSNSPFYNLAILAQEIASQEAKYCYFEYLGYMLFYPQFSIDKKNIGQGQTASKIYIIEDKYTGKKLNIAIRSCAIPSGFF